MFLTLTLGSGVLEYDPPEPGWDLGVLGTVPVCGVLNIPSAAAAAAGPRLAGVTLDKAFIAVTCGVTLLLLLLYCWWLLGLGVAFFCLPEEEGRSGLPDAAAAVGSSLSARARSSRSILSAAADWTSRGENFSSFFSTSCFFCGVCVRGLGVGGCTLTAGA